MTDEGMDVTVRALAEPRRREILRLVAASELSAGEIADHFSVTRQAVSQHLQVLHGAGLLEERRVGTKRYFRLRVDGLDDLHRFLEDMWSSSLVGAKGAAERGNDSNGPVRADRTA